MKYLVLGMRKGERKPKVWGSALQYFTVHGAVKWSHGGAGNVFILAAESAADARKRVGNTLQIRPGLFADEAGEYILRQYERISSGWDIKLAECGRVPESFTIIRSPTIG